MKAVVVNPGEGRFVAFGPGGPGVTFKAAAAETDGGCSVWEGRVGPGMVGAGPHYHHTIDEFFYVLEGEVVLLIGDETHTARAGTFAFVPRGTIHGFRNTSSEHATLLAVHNRSGFERYVEELAALTARSASREERAALAARFDIISAPAPAAT